MLHTGTVTPVPSAAMGPTSTSNDLAPARALGAFVLPPDCLYLDCAAQAPRLAAMLAAGRATLANTAPWTTSFDAWESQIETLRSSLARSAFDGDVDGVAMVPSAAYGLATAARNLELHDGDAVLVLEGQFPSNLLPWQQRCAEAGARVVAVERDAATDWTNAVLSALERTPRIRVVALPHVRWDDGARLDLDRIAPAVRASGAALVLDLSQSLGALPVDLAQWQPDFVVSVGYKWLLGPQGLAWLWAAPRWRDTGAPIEQHWSQRDAGDGWRFDADAPPRLRTGARRFDAGGVTAPLQLAMAQAAIDQVASWQIERISAALGARTGALDDALDACGLSAWKTPGHAPHLTALRPPADRLDAVRAALAQEGVVCTKRRGVLRIAPHLHVSDDDMRRVADIVASTA